MLFIDHATVRHNSSRTIFILCAGLFVSGCGMAPSQNGMTTASLRPRPEEGLVLRPYPSLTPASTLGAPMTARPAKVPVQAGYTGSPKPLKTYHYNWNGNHERLQAGAAQSPPTTPVSNMKWKPSPVAGPKSAQLPMSRAPLNRAAAGREIIVGPGDTLYSLATKHDVTMAGLMQANHLNSPTIKVSQHLVLPAPLPSASQ